MLAHLKSEKKDRLYLSSPQAHPQQCPTSSHSQLCHPEMSCLASHQTCKGQTSCLHAEGTSRPDIPSPSPGGSGVQGWSCLSCPRAALLLGQGGGTGPDCEALPCPGKPPLLMWHPGTSRQWWHFPVALCRLLSILCLRAFF